MTEMIESATLCATRQLEGNIEVLMTRREVWNHLKCRPMRYPGEWIFPGGAVEEGEDLVAAAIREFREETSYAGPVHNLMMLVASEVVSRGCIYPVTIFSGTIDNGYEFESTESDEVIDIAWGRPQEWLDLIHSQEFNEEQLYRFRTRNLGNGIFGKYAVHEREIPELTIRILEYLNSA